MDQLTGSSLHILFELDPVAEGAVETVSIDRNHDTSPPSEKRMRAAERECRKTAFTSPLDDFPEDQIVWTQMQKLIARTIARIFNQAIRIEADSTRSDWLTVIAS